MFGLVVQMRRAVVSIPSNIAEGRRRRTDADYCHFLTIAYGSGAELETQIEIIKRLPFGKDLNYFKSDLLLLETMKMLNGLISSII